MAESCLGQQHEITPIRAVKDDLLRWVFIYLSEVKFSLESGAVSPPLGEGPGMSVGRLFPSPVGRGVRGEGAKQ